MQHLTSDEWTAFAAGGTTAERRRDIERHLAGCEQCRMQLGWTAETDPHGTTARRVGAFDDLPRGTSVGRYLVVERLGTGGMGMVYAAFDPELDRKIALKLLRADLGNSQRQFRARMLREAQAMARLQHPNVIAVHDVGTFGKRVFLAMELVEGGTLKAWLQETRKPGRAWIDAVLDMFIQAGRGLAAAHRAGLVHRDFKPENVLIGSDGRARVTDFGLARAASVRDGASPSTPGTTERARKFPPSALAETEERPKGAGEAVAEAAAVASIDEARLFGDDALDESMAEAGDDDVRDTASLDAPLTRAGTMMGTPGYMPPEQCQGQPIDARADQFSFCASLYEALYGFRAFGGHAPDEVIDNTLAGAIRPPPADSEVPAWVRRALFRGLATAPAQRWPSMEALLDELGRDPARRRRRWLAAAGMTLAVATLVVGAQQWGARNLRCQGGERHLANVWGLQQRQALRTAFAKSGRVFAPQAAAATEQALDRYAASWSAMHGDACEATRLRGEQTEAMMALRMACLDQRHKELGALTQLLAVADDQTIERAVQAVQALPPPSLCADVQALMQVAPLPNDASLRAQIEAARTSLAAARAQLAAGKYADGLAPAEEVPPVATAIGYRPLLAEALELVAELRWKSGDYHGADRAWRDALYAAEESRLDDLKSAAAVRLANVSVDLQGYEQAHEWLKLAEASIKRGGAGGELQVDLWISIAMVWWREARYGEAETAARKAVSLAAQVLPEQHLLRAAAYRTLGDVLKYEGRYDDGLQLLEKARTILEQQLGPDHPDVGAVLRKEIDVYSMQHDGGRALPLGRRVLALLSKSLPPEHLQIAQVHTNIAEALGLLGRYEEALAEERLALPTYERVFGPDSENVAVSHTNMGFALLQLGRDEEARRHLTRAVALYEKVLPPDSPDLAEPLLRLGQLEVNERHAREATRLLERAMGLRMNDRDPTEMLAEIEEALARALLLPGAGDAVGRARARALLARARDQWLAGGRAKQAAAAAALLAATTR